MTADDPLPSPSPYQIRLDALTVAARATAGSRVPDDAFFEFAAKVEAFLRRAGQPPAGRPTPRVR